MPPMADVVFQTYAPEVPSPGNAATIPENGGGGGGGAPADPGNSPESQQFFDRLMTPPSSARETIYADYIDGLVVAGVWANLDALYVMCAADEGTIMTNLIQEAYQATRSESASTLTITADVGVSSGSIAKKFNSNFNPTTAVSPKYTRNDAHVSVWISDVTQENVPAIDQGVAGGSNETTVLYPKWSDNNIYWRVNGAGDVTTGIAAASVAGHTLMQRTGANAQEIFKNGVSVGTNANASAALFNGVICARYGRNLRLFSIGKSMTSGQVASFNTLTAALITAITGVTP